MGRGCGKYDFWMGVVIRCKRARGWLAVRDSSRLLHIAISLRGTEMKRKPVSVCNVANRGIQECRLVTGQHCNSRPCRYAHDILYKAGAGGIPSESRKLG